MTPHVVVVGAGFTGASAARVMAERGHRVLVVDERDHVGGNAHDELRLARVRVHTYGPHLFHTSSSNVVDFLTRFGTWFPYRHRVMGTFQGMTYPLPPNFDLVDKIAQDADRVKAALLATYATDSRVPLHRLHGHPDELVRRVALQVQQIVYESYTAKMWGRYAGDLLASVQARVPVVMGYQTGYFTDDFQALPTEGYAGLFARMLDHPRIETRTGTSWTLRDNVRSTPVIYTGPIDGLLDYALGTLPYRSISFRETTTTEHLDGGATLNFNDDRPQTRVTDMAFTAEGAVAETVWVEETPQDYEHGVNERFYPVQADRWRAKHQEYVDLLSDRYQNIVVGGRLGRYRYFDMDQACAMGLTLGASA